MIFKAKHDHYNEVYLYGAGRQWSISNVTGTFRERCGLNFLRLSHLSSLHFSNPNSAESLLPCSVSTGLQSILTGSPWRPLTNTYTLTHMHTYESYLRIMECDITSSDFTHKMHIPKHTLTHTHTESNQSQWSLSASPGLPHPVDVLHRAVQLSSRPTHCMYTSPMTHLGC